MDISEVEIIQKYGKHCDHCNQNTLLPYEYEFILYFMGIQLSQKKTRSYRIQRKK